jgi:nucleoid DNA-binding protein
LQENSPELRYLVENQAISPEKIGVSKGGIPTFPAKESMMAKTAKAATKSEVYKQIAEKTELSRKQVAAVFDAMAEVVKNELGKKGPGVFALPGLAKMVIRNKPAVAAHKGIDPFTKQEKMFKAKPATRVVKIRPLKALKDMVK